MKTIVPCRAASLAFSALLAAAPTAATVHLCRDSAGRSAYQSEPCPAGTLVRSIEEDRSLNVLPSSPGPVTKPASESRPTGEIHKKSSASKKARAVGGDPAERRFLREGMDEAEVLHKIGTPDVRGTGPAPSGRGKAKRWTYLPDPGDPQTITTVFFRDGKVLAIERKVAR